MHLHHVGKRFKDSQPYLQDSSESPSYMSSHGNPQLSVMVLASELTASGHGWRPDTALDKPFI